jgi:hypothetical protein
VVSPSPAISRSSGVLLSKADNKITEDADKADLDGAAWLCHAWVNERSMHFAANAIILERCQP